MKKTFIYIILIVIIFPILFSTKCLGAENLEIQKPKAESVNINNLTIHSDCILMVEKNTGDILYERKADEIMYPASTTKILTAIIVLENCDLNEIVTVSSLALKAVPATYTTSNIQIGEELRVEDLLYTMLIPSANDAANALAEHVAGSITGFSSLMNEKAKEIGCTSSNFTNPSGVHDENLYTTAHDLALIARYAMNNETFRKIVTTTTYTLPNTEAYSKSDRTFSISNALVKPSFKDYYYEYATGIKTGYTNASKDCLVASAKKDDVEFIIVVLGAGYTETGLRQKYVDCKTLFNFAFDNYTSYYKNLQEKNQSQLSILTNADITESENLEIDYELLKFLSTLVAIFLIILALNLVFGKRKKKNRYKFSHRKKAKH